jgi:salicylate hydroxylase
MADVQLMIDRDRDAVQMGLDDPRADGDMVEGRVTLLGDACHPTLPFLGQGGVMSIEDGYVVAACLDKYFDEPGPRLRPLTRRFAKTGRQWWFARPARTRRAPLSHGLADKELVAVEVAREWQAGSPAGSGMDWLYNYDATAIAI